MEWRFALGKTTGISQTDRGLKSGCCSVDVASILSTGWNHSIGHRVSSRSTRWEGFVGLVNIHAFDGYNIHYTSLRETLNGTKNIALL